MKRLSKIFTPVAVGIVMWFGICAAASAQSGSTTPAAPAVPNQTKDSIGGGLVTFEAVLVEPEKKAAAKTATVNVKVAGINLVDPDVVGPKPQQGQGHLHYQLDNGPVIATTATKLSFHGLTSGPHKIVILIAGNDHNPISRDNTLTINIP